MFGNRNRMLIIIRRSTLRVGFFVLCVALLCGNLLAGIKDASAASRQSAVADGREHGGSPNPNVVLTSITICKDTPANEWDALPEDEVLRTGNYHNRIYVKVEGYGGDPDPNSPPDSVIVNISSETNPNGISLALYEYGGYNSNKFRNYMTIPTGSPPSGLVPLAGENISEYASADYNTTSTGDADAFDNHFAVELPSWNSRGSARDNGDIVNPAAHKSFLRAAGAERIYARSGLVQDRAWVKNQADWFYISCHGVHLANELQVGGGNFYVEQGDADGWKNCDLERCFIAACSVLDSRDYNGYWLSGPNGPVQHAKSPGEFWGKLGVRELLGYSADSAPTGVDTNVLQYWFDLYECITNPLPEDAPYIWLLANADSRSWHACAIFTIENDRAYYFIKWHKLLGLTISDYPAATYKSEGWNTIHRIN